MPISERSTNTKGFVHFGGDIVSGVEDGVGIVVGSASTGAIPYLEPIADSTASIGIRAKGTGDVRIGNSSNAIALKGPVSIGNASTTAIPLIQQYTVQYTIPALAASASAESTYTVAGLTTNCGLFLTPQDPLNAAYTYQARCSTAAELVVRGGNLLGSTIGSAGTTGRFKLIAFQF